MTKATRILALLCFAVALVLAMLLALAAYRAEEARADVQQCAAQSGQIQPDGRCVRVLHNVETGAYHLRPAR